MSHYKLTYFNVRARGELSRLILKCADVPFDDVRLTSEWPQFKSETPFGKLPVLHVDGKVLAQSNTIARYLARKHGLAGVDDWDQALADMYVDCATDLMNAMIPAAFEKDATKQAEMFEKFFSEQVVPHVKIIEKDLAKNGSGFLVGSQLTWADLAYFNFFSGIMEKNPNVVKDAPHLRQLVSRVASIPQIKNWIAIRPQSSM
nr:GSTsigma1d protein [Diaphanosoma celebensis]